MTNYNAVAQFSVINNIPVGKIAIGAAAAAGLFFLLSVVKCYGNRPQP